MLVATVIDVTSTDIVRDAINLLKSIRIFGGSLNRATILVGIIGESDKSLLDDNLLSTLVALHPEIHFLGSVTGRLAKTLNKFKAFDVFDSTKYDYFLWLDADITVFRDPMPFLHMHKYPGEVECVPDFYSYMRRFPSVNQSAGYWNPSLPTSYLLGEGEVAPNGICNTGVLFFDSLSLSTFKEGLHEVLSNDTYMEAHGKDRFVDSLIFTKIVNEADMEVTILPHSMNYMALFEIELQEEIILTDIVFAHFVSDTELYCLTNPVVGESSGEADHATTDDGCSCVYRNKLLPPKESLLRDTVQQKILSNITLCQIFAGKHMPQRVDLGQQHRIAREIDSEAGMLKKMSFFLPTKDSDDDDVAAAAGVQNTLLSPPLLQCTQLSPPGAPWIIHSRSAGDPVSFDVAVECRWSAPAAGQVSWGSGEQSAAGRIQLHVVVSAPPSDSSVGEIVLHSQAEEIEATCSTNSNCVAAAVLPVSLPTPRTQAKTVFHLHTVVSSVDGAHRLEIQSTFTVVEDELVPPGQVHYSSNLMLSSKSLALESQLRLPEFLNSRVLRGTGVAVCCETHKGVTAVKRLMESWRGEHLLVIVESAPRLYATPIVDGNGVLGMLATTSQLASELASYCDAHRRPGGKLVCVLTTPPASPVLRNALSAGVPYSRHLATAMRSGSVSFVYTDMRQGYGEQCLGLLEWSRVLTKYGVLMGSQYGTERIRATTVWRVTAGLLDTRLAVNFLADQLDQHPLLTFLERDPAYCEPFAALRLQAQDKSETAQTPAMREMAARLECSPAWYLIKQRSMR